MKGPGDLDVLKKKIIIFLNSIPAYTLLLRQPLLHIHLLLSLENPHILHRKQIQYCASYMSKLYPCKVICIYCSCRLRSGYAFIIFHWCNVRNNCVANIVLILCIDFVINCL